jgi:DNA-directed RNA polymerase specialized sigma subunit
MPRYDSLRKANPKEVLRFIEKHPDWSLREIGDRFKVSASTICRIKQKGGRK